MTAWLMASVQILSFKGRPSLSHPCDVFVDYISSHFLFNLQALSPIIDDKERDDTYLFSKERDFMEMETKLRREIRELQRENLKLRNVIVASKGKC